MADKPNFFAGILSLKGRTSKNSFWVSVWVFGTLNILAVGGLLTVSGSAPSLASDSVALLALASCYPWLALVVRRLHDSNRSGWWLLSFVTVIGMIPLVCWLLLSGGTHGPNRFGPDPAKRKPKAVDMDARAPSSTASAPTPSTDAVADLKRLAKLRDSGVLTEEEFVAQKERLLKAV
jgi:uncharacterized membrane protein YhaH (DUF805 family)